MSPSRETQPVLIVVAAVILRDGRVLLGRREAGSHLEHHWEFPGGKVEPGEDPPTALARELAEELGVSAHIGSPFAFNYHEYPTRRILLLTYLATIETEPRPLACAALGWFDRAEVAALPMPPADGPILAVLLPLLAPGDPLPVAGPPAAQSMVSRQQ